MDNKLVRYSRAGDVFHYRWVACRCLRLINPESSLKKIIIEGSDYPEKAGEYVIDVSEYEKNNEDSSERIYYFQLKHSTKRINTPFTLSELKKTINGFAKRFKSLSGKNKKLLLNQTKFLFVSNRKVGTSIKESISFIGQGKKVNARFLNTFKKYTKLNNKQLKDFCSSFEFVDSEDNYIGQRKRLRIKLSLLLAETPSDGTIDSLVALVQDRALPHSNGIIVREHVLSRIGVTSIRDLFPAPKKFEDLTEVIKREQHNYLLNNVIKSSGPVIIHASGGVGKSVVCHQLSESLPKGSVSVMYDCFGLGKYRNPSEPRHRHRDALVQIVNEIASNNNLCDFLIPKSSDLDDAFLRAFFARIKNAAKILQKNNSKAVLAIFIDAIDNAEMAAKEFSDTCFVNDLLREGVPNGCRIVMFSRTERLNLFINSPKIKKIELRPFSSIETSAFLKKHFSDVTDDDGLEFHRLTGGNPRVQANSLSEKNINISDILLGLGESGATVDEQIETQLNASVSLIKEKLPSDFQQHIDSICIGLASLPPFIPLDVLATAAGVQVSEVKTFVSDLGRPLLLLDGFVQFRDEPTETWFRQHFSASKEKVERYINQLKPLAKDSSYVSEAIPSLLLQSESYNELISLALSEDFLPENNPVDKRNIQVYRLQFAFKASLKKKRYVEVLEDLV